MDLKDPIKAQGTSDHAGNIFGHAGPFSSQDIPGLVQEDPDVRNFDVKGLESPIKMQSCHKSYFENFKKEKHMTDHPLIGTLFSLLMNQHL